MRASGALPVMLTLVALSAGPADAAPKRPPYFPARAEAGEAAEVRYRVTGLPAGHGYERGRWVGLYAPVPRSQDRELVGYALVVSQTAGTMLVTVQHLGTAPRPADIRVGPLADEAKIGKALGVV